MAGVPQKTLNWLYDVLKREYHDPNRTYSDLAHVLARNPGFAPRTDVYTFENGVSALLVVFKGTIPVNFRGNTYRFPIALWVPHAYPYEAPMIYVTPTEEMMIRPGQHVGGDGKIYHPYLAHWREAWERSNLLDFLSILTDVFAKEPPVQSRAYQHQQPVQATPPPVPPLPREMQHPHPSTATVQAAPPQPVPESAPAGPPHLPPKEPTQGRMSSPAPTASPTPKPGRYDAPPPLPGQAQNASQPPIARPQYPYGNGNIQRPSSSTNYLPHRSSSLRQSMPPPLPHQQQQPTYDPHQYRPQPSRPGESQQQPPVPPVSSPPPAQAHGYEQASVPPEQYRQISGSQLPPDRAISQQYHHSSQATPAHPYSQPYQHAPPAPKPPAPAPNLLDSPFDIPLPAPTTSHTSHPSNIPAPPIPVNPEKEALLTHLSHQITSSLHSQIAQSGSALQPLSSQNTALQATLQNLTTELHNLKALHSTLSSNISLLSTSLANSDKVITSAKARAAKNDIPAVDEMLVPPTVVARQLYDAACEEKGIETTILALQEGFVRGRVGSEVWSRRTRELAREAFKRRWMVRKVATGMGLEVGG